MTNIFFTTELAKEFEEEFSFLGENMQKYTLFSSNKERN